MNRSAFWSCTAVVLLAACGRGDKAAVAAADSTRDLQLAPVDTTALLADVPADTAPPARPETVFVEKPAAKPPVSKPKPAPSTSAPAAAPADAKPAAAAGRTLASGTSFSGTIVDSIDSKTTKAGDVVSIRVSEDVKDAQGRVVIPAGSTVSAEISQIKWSENKGDPGTLKFATGSVSLDGKRKAIVASVSKPEFLYRKRGGALGDASKVAGGAAAGAVVGGLLGKGTGAAIGGVLGGAVGTQRAIETKDRDIIVKPGSTVTLTLKEEFVS